MMDKDLIELEKLLNDQAEFLEKLYIPLPPKEFSNEVKDAMIESWHSTIH